MKATFAKLVVTGLRLRDSGAIMDDRSRLMQCGREQVDQRYMHDREIIMVCVLSGRRLAHMVRKKGEPEPARF